MEEINEDIGPLNPIVFFCGVVVSSDESGSCSQPCAVSEMAFHSIRNFRQGLQHYAKRLPTPTQFLHYYTSIPWEMRTAMDKAMTITAAMSCFASASVSVAEVCCIPFERRSSSILRKVEEIRSPYYRSIHDFRWAIRILDSERVAHEERRQVALQQLSDRAAWFDIMSG